MFVVGILIGAYAYCIFLLGLLGLLYNPLVILFTLAFLVGCAAYYRKSIQKINILNGINDMKKDMVSILLIGVLIVQALVNMIGVFGPELGFDALWYHLTIPKIYLLHHSISYIQGGLLYYSAMPKLLELLYTGGLAFGSTVFPKFIHFGFGILTLFVLFGIARKFLSQRFALLVVVIFYANLVVGWESISAYIDLGRTFFELLSLYALLEWTEGHKRKLFYLSAFLMGFAITTKLLAVFSLIMVLVLLAFFFYEKKVGFTKLCLKLLLYASIAFFVSFPWLIFSFLNTGNPVYPFFSHTYPVTFSLQLVSPINFFSSFWNIFLYAADPINPFYLMTLPLIFLYIKKWPKLLQGISIFVIGGLLFWYITPRTGGGRFILPYLPLLSLLSVISVVSLSQKRLKQFLFCVAIGIALSSISYRLVANTKFIPVLLGRESEARFLTTHLNFSFGDFYDTDGYFKTHIKPIDTVLLYGFHNLYYVDFPFIDATFAQKGDVFTYIATQNSGLPKRFQTWTLMYTNPITHVALFSAGGIPWTY